MKIAPPSDAVIQDAIRILQEGGVIVHATETCYGLACDLTNPQAVAKLFAIKHRPLEQPVSGLFPSIDEAKRWVEWPARADELAQQYLPGPLTLILPLTQSLYPTPSGGKTLGVRISSNPLAHQLASLAGTVISTTSANIHSEANPYSAQEILARFSQEEHQPDLIIDSGVLPAVPPSTIVDLTNEGTVKRQGSIETK